MELLSRHKVVIKRVSRDVRRRQERLLKRVQRQAPKKIRAVSLNDIVDYTASVDYPLAGLKLLYGAVSIGPTIAFRGSLSYTECHA